MGPAFQFCHRIFLPQPIAKTLQILQPIPARVLFTSGQQPQIIRPGEWIFHTGTVIIRTLNLFAAAIRYAVAADVLDNLPANCITAL